MDDGSLRASDAERAAVIERLQIAHEEGRISNVEIVERLAAASAARTVGELAALTRDLPDPVAPSAAPPRTSGRTADRGLAMAWRSWVGVNLLCLVIWLAILAGTGGAASYPWFLWVAGPWGAVLLLATVLGRTTGPPDDR